MKVAAAAYPLDWFDTWSAYEDKISNWVAEAAGNGAELLVFPEYGAMELASLAGREIARDLEQSLFAVAERLPAADALHQQLAAIYDVHILAASGPAQANGSRPVNRARLITPDGRIGIQDKQIMTRFESEIWKVSPGGPLTLFETDLGKIGVLICYDSEFPLFGRAFSDADLILVPSCTEALSGYSRVRIGAMARALENQCVTVMSSIVGPADWSEAVDINTGCGGIFGPPDQGFPATGVLSEGQLDQPGWTFAEVDLEAISHVRTDGAVLNRRDWSEQPARADAVTSARLGSERP